MKLKEKQRLDRFAFALGSVTLATPFAAIPIVPADCIAAAWDERLARRKSGSGFVPRRLPISCAT